MDWSLTHNSNNQPSVSSFKENKNHFLNDETNVRIPRHVNGQQMTDAERLRYLELKVNAHLNFGVHDPFFGNTAKPNLCMRSSELGEFGCQQGWEGYDGQDCAGLYDQNICLDDLPSPRTDPFESLSPQAIDNPECLVYDFGIRKQPQFGAVMARTFGCEVHAFDPSPVAMDWWNSSQAEGLRNLPNYHFHPYGAGGRDGDLTLHEYNWGQVSIIKFPHTYLVCDDDTDNAQQDGKKSKPKKHCKMKDNQQKRFNIPVKTLPTIRKELGHENRTIDVLKLDVEGSEYAFVEHMLDTQGGCPDYINQLTLEWHHMSWDERYGEGSSPNINTISTLLHSCRLQLFWKYSTWPATDKLYVDMGMNNVRYSLASYIKVPKDSGIDRSTGPLRKDSGKANVS